jgi:hypothetical protein
MSRRLFALERIRGNRGRRLGSVVVRLGAAMRDISVPDRPESPLLAPVRRLERVFTIPTAAAGLSDWSASADRRVRRVGAVHALLNDVMVAAYLWSWRSRRRGRRGTAILGSLIGGTLGWISGFLGGHLSLRLDAGQGETA